MTNTQLHEQSEGDTLNDLATRVEQAFENIQRQKRSSANFSLEPVWTIINAVPDVAAELRRAMNMKAAIERHDRFNIDDLRYTGPDDPALDPSCGEDWRQLLASLARPASLKARARKEGE